MIEPPTAAYSFSMLFLGVFVLINILVLQRDVMVFVTRCGSAVAVVVRIQMLCTTNRC